MPSKRSDNFYIAMTAVVALLVLLFLTWLWLSAKPAAAQIPPGDLVFCISTTTEDGNLSYALAWDNLPEVASLYVFRGIDWSLATKIGLESGVYPLEPGFFPWFVPELGLKGTCGSLETSPVFRCSWEGDEFVIRWSGLVQPTRLDVLYGHDFLVPYIVGPEDGAIGVGNSSDTYWFAPGYALEGGCSWEIYIPLVEVNQ
jgi:hypothetical protein